MSDTPLNADDVHYLVAMYRKDVDSTLEHIEKLKARCSHVYKDGRSAVLTPTLGDKACAVCGAKVD